MALTKISRSLLDTGVSDSSDATAITIDSSENVGIACTPHFPFDVQLNSSRRIGFNYSDSQNSILSHDGSGNIETLGLRGNTILFYSDYDASNPDGVERMRIDSSGNVGIGTTSASQLLEISGSSDPRIRINNSSTALSAGTSIGGIEYQTNDASGEGTGVGASIEAIAEGSFGYRQQGVLLAFKTRNSGESETNTERMRIDSAGTVQMFGNVRVGTVSAGNGVVDLNGASGSYAIDYINDGGNRRFVVNASTGNVQNTNNSYGSLSDSKIKENIVDATNKLEDLNKVKVRNFNIKGEEHKQIGVIAQELESIFPSMVEDHKDYDEEGEDLGTVTKSVKYSVFVPILIKAIQEQQEQIETLQSEINTLKGG